MTGPVFVDTNILIYADDRAAPAKRERAQELLRDFVRDQTAWLSLQVLQEYFAVATRKLGISAEDARSRVELYARFHVVRLEPSDVLAAIDLHRAHSFSIWGSRGDDLGLPDAPDRGSPGWVHDREAGDRESIYQRLMR